MRILLVRPARGSVRGLEANALLEPLGLESLAGALRMHQVAVADQRLGDRLADYARVHRPRLCGVSCSFTTEARTALAACRAIKRLQPDCTVVVGGQHASLWPIDFADPAVDGIVVGEGETTIQMVARAVEGGAALGQVPGVITNTPDGQVACAKRVIRVENLDLLPLPFRAPVAHHLHRFYMGYERPTALVESSRGCDRRCNFCAVWKFHEGRVRSKSVERVVEELQAAAAPHVFFTDDNFLHDTARVQALAERLLELGLRRRFTFQARTDTVAEHPELLELWAKVGPSTVFLGLEAISLEGLQALRKGNTPEKNDRALEVLARSGLGYAPNFMVDPRATVEDFAALREYVTARGLRNAAFCVVTPLPGTDLFEEMKGELLEGNPALYDLFHAVTATGLARDEFYRQLALLWGEVRQLQAAPRRGRLRRVLRGLLRRQIRMGDVRRGMNVSRQLSDPAVYLADHERHSEKLSPGEMPRFTKAAEVGKPAL